MSEEMKRDKSDKLQMESLELDALDRVAGGTGSGSGMVETDGTVVEILPNGGFQVNIEDGTTIVANISGKLRMNYVRIQSGDRVRVEYYPNDPNHPGRVIGRYK